MVVIDITPRQAIEQLEKDLGLTSDDLAHALSVSRRTLERWRSGESYPQRDSREKLAELVELIDLNNYFQEAFIDSESVREWVHSKSRYLSWLTPADMIRLGRPDRARGALEVIESGIFL